MPKQPGYSHQHDYRFFTVHVDKSAGLAATRLFVCPDFTVELEDVILVVTEAFATNAGGDLKLGIATDDDKFMRSVNVPVTAALKAVYSTLGTKTDTSHVWVAATAFDGNTGKVLLKAGEVLLIEAAAAAGTGEYDVLVQYRINAERLD